MISGRQGGSAPSLRRRVVPQNGGSHGRPCPSHRASFRCGPSLRRGMGRSDGRHPGRPAALVLEFLGAVPKQPVQFRFFCYGPLCRVALELATLFFAQRPSGSDSHPEGSTAAPVKLEWSFALARSSAVEHYLDTVGVGGSRPPAPTNWPPFGRLFLRAVTSDAGIPSAPIVNRQSQIANPVHSTVTLLARFRGWSTSQPRSTAM